MSENIQCMPMTHIHVHKREREREREREILQEFWVNTIHLELSIHHDLYSSVTTN